MPTVVNRHSGFLFTIANIWLAGCEATGILRKCIKRIHDKWSHSSAMFLFTLLVRGRYCVWAFERQKVLEVSSGCIANDGEELCVRELHAKNSIYFGQDVSTGLVGVWLVHS